MPAARARLRRPGLPGGLEGANDGAVRRRGGRQRQRGQGRVPARGGGQVGKIISIVLI